MDSEGLFGRYGLIIIGVLIVILIAGGAYFMGYVNGRPAQENATITYIYMYVTPTPVPCPTPLPPNVLLINNQPTAIIGKDTSLTWDAEVGKKDDADKATWLPAVNTNGLLIGSGYYNVKTSTFHAYTNGYSFDTLSAMFGPASAASIINTSPSHGTVGTVGDMAIDWGITMDPRLNYTQRSVGNVSANGTFIPPTFPDDLYDAPINSTFVLNETIMEVAMHDNETGFNFTVMETATNNPTPWDAIFDRQQAEREGSTW